MRVETITTSTDVYALGVLLYELLCGKRPFHLGTTSPMEVMRAVCEQTPTAPSHVWKENPELAPPDASRKLSGELDTIVLMAMRKEPARRYVSVGQLAEDVQAFLGGYPIRARTDAWGYRYRKFVRRHKAGFAATVAVALSLVGFSIGMGLLARRAERERMRAEREAQFLNSIFQSTTPGEARGKQITGRELLEDGARRVDSEFAGEPELQARLLDNIGRAYEGLGLYEKSEPLMQRAYDLRRQTLGDSNLDTASTLDGLANVIRLKTDYKRAEPLFRKALAIRQSKLSPTDPLVAASMANLGECLYLEEENQEAESLLRQALAIERGHGYDEGVSTSDNYLSLILERKGAFGEATQLLRESVEISRRTDGADSPNYANALHNLAGALIDAGDLSGAEAMDRESLAIRRKISDPDNPNLGYPLNNLGFIQLARGNWAAAEPLLKENLEVRGWPVKKDASVAGALNNWARVLQEKGDYAGADESFQKAIAMMREAAGPQSWNLAKMLANLGLLRADQGKFSEAEQLERDALSMREKLGGKESPDLASSQFNLAVIYSLEHKPDSAEPLLRRAIEIRKKELSAGHPAIVSAETRLGEALLDQNKGVEAEALLRQAIAEIHAEPFPVTAWQIAEPEIALGVALAASGRRNEAEPMLRNAESRLKDYPEAALHRQILQRADSARARKG